MEKFNLTYQFHKKTGLPKYSACAWNIYSFSCSYYTHVLLNGKSICKDCLKMKEAERIQTTQLSFNW